MPHIDPPVFMDWTHFKLNEHLFTRYECEIACAVQLFIRAANNNQLPTDKDLARVLGHLRGRDGFTGVADRETLPPTTNMVLSLQYHEREDHRIIYLSVCVFIPGIDELVGILS